MSYFRTSITSRSFWRHALFCGEAGKLVLSAVGALYLFVNILDTFKIYEKTKYTQYQIIFVVLFAIIYTIVTRRPISKVMYKIPKRDLAIEVRIGDIFGVDGEIVISSSTTFDTDMSSGLIAQNSMQGQLALRMFKGQTDEIDRQISESLKNEKFEIIEGKPGKLHLYPIGTVAKVSAHGRNYYFLAMSDMNKYGTAESSLEYVETSLIGLWKFMTERGELGDLIVPLVGTGRGRVEYPRKKVIERIAQSFINASRDRIFSNKLVIVVYPADVERFGINLFEVRDYLGHSLHI